MDYRNKVFAERSRQMDKTSKRSTNNRKQQGTIHYPWQFWCIVVIEITAVVIAILWLGLSVKAVIQDVQLMVFENKVEGTVTVAEYEGAKPVSYGDSSVDSTSYKHVHYVISFDREVSGYRQYEYRADNMISTKKSVGDRFVVLFNNINKPTLIQKEDIAIDNILLLSFVIAVGLVLLFRKKIWQCIIRVGNKADKYLFYT
jgi:hypothetical protein